MKQSNILVALPWFFHLEPDARGWTTLVCFVIVDVFILLYYCRRKRASYTSHKAPKTPATSAPMTTISKVDAAFGDRLASAEDRNGIHTPNTTAPTMNSRSRFQFIAVICRSLLSKVRKPKANRTSIQETPNDAE